MKNPSPAYIGKPIEIEVTYSFEKALKDFRQLVQKERIIGQVKARMEYKKPSEKKRLKRREAQERRMLQAIREKQIESGEWDKRKQQKDKKRAERQEQMVRKQERSDS